MIRLVKLCSWHKLPASLISLEFAGSYFNYLASVCSQQIFALGFFFFKAFTGAQKRGWMTVLKWSRVVRKMLYLKDCYVAVIYIDCYKLYVRSRRNIQILIISTDMISWTGVFSRSYEPINPYVEWPAFPD